MKQTIITEATLAGFFKVKSEEKRATILESLYNSEALADYENEQILEVLTAEVTRRAEAYRAKLARNAAKVVAEAEKPLISSHEADSHITKLDGGDGVYILTAAQNNSDVDPIFLAALENYATFNNAKILCAKVTYNKNGFQVAQDAEEGIYYDSRITKYLVDTHIALSDNIHFIGQANVLPTAKNPLSGFEAITAAGVSAVIPASKIALKCLARLRGQEGKILFSTGMVTKRNYILRKAGAVASSEHNIGALIVEVSGNTFKARNVELMPNSLGFYDNGVYYSGVADSREHVPPVALQLGDIHAEKLSPEMLERLCRFIGDTNPEQLHVHDVADFSSRNHHNIKDNSFMFQQAINQTTVAGDLEAVATVLQEFHASFNGTIKVIESNHDLAIDRWLMETDFKADPCNALTYLELMLAKYKHIRDTGESLNTLEYALYNIAKLDKACKIDFLRVDDSLMVAGVECGVHGHVGINGATGSPTSFRKLGVPMNTGHTHSPSIVGSVYTAGCCELDMGYNIGASSWQLAHITTYANGQRQIIFM